MHATLIYQSHTICNIIKLLQFETLQYCIKFHQFIFFTNIVGDSKPSLIWAYATTSLQIFPSELRAAKGLLFPQKKA